MWKFPLVTREGLSRLGRAVSHTPRVFSGGAASEKALECAAGWGGLGSPQEKGGF